MQTKSSSCSSSFFPLTALHGCRGTRGWASASPEGQITHTSAMTPASSSPRSSLEVPQQRTDAWGQENDTLDNLSHHHWRRHTVNHCVYSSTVELDNLPSENKHAWDTTTAASSQLSEETQFRLLIPHLSLNTLSYLLFFFLFLFISNVVETILACGEYCTNWSQENQTDFARGWISTLGVLSIDD